VASPIHRDSSWKIQLEDSAALDEYRMREGKDLTDFPFSRPESRYQLMDLVMNLQEDKSGKRQKLELTPSSTAVSGQKRPQL
jgi:hypothetical protein